jgi:hypothetical protein
MEKFLLISAFSLVLSTNSFAAENRKMYCHSKNAELAFQTIVYGSLAVGEYTSLNGLRNNLPAEAQSTDYRYLFFYNQNRVFRVEEPQLRGALTFTLLAQENNDLVVSEAGICEELP